MPCILNTILELGCANSAKNVIITVKMMVGSSVIASTFHVYFKYRSTDLVLCFAVSPCQVSHTYKSGFYLHFQQICISVITVKKLLQIAQI